MAIYTMVKNNTFNGMPLPDIAWRDAEGGCRVIRRFGYEDFKTRPFLNERGTRHV